MMHPSTFRHVAWLLPLLAFGGWLLLDNYFLRGMSLFPALLLGVALGLAALIAAIRRRPWRTMAVGAALSLLLAAAILRDATGANRAARNAVDALRAAHMCAPSLDKLQGADPTWVRLQTPTGPVLRKRPRGSLGTPQSLLYWQEPNGAGIARVGVLDAGETYRDFPACGPGASARP
jgi:hypothetical protein